MLFLATLTDTQREEGFVLLEVTIMYEYTYRVVVRDIILA